MITHIYSVCAVIDSERRGRARAGAGDTRAWQRPCRQEAPGRIGSAFFVAASGAQLRVGGLFFGNCEEGAAEDCKREVLFLPCKESVPLFVNQLSSFVQLNYARVCASLRKLSQFAQKLNDYAVFTQ